MVPWRRRLRPPHILRVLVSRIITPNFNLLSQNGNGREEVPKRALVRDQALYSHATLKTYTRVKNSCLSRERSITQALGDRF